MDINLEFKPLGPASNGVEVWECKLSEDWLAYWFEDPSFKEANELSLIDLSEGLPENIEFDTLDQAKEFLIKRFANMTPPYIPPEDAEAAKEYFNNPIYEAKKATTLADIKVLTTSSGDEFPLPITKEFRNSQGQCVARDVVTIYFKELLQVTQARNVTKGAILVQAMHPEDLYPIDTWIPKKLCSNLEYDPENVELGKNTVKVWRPFAEDKLSELCGGYSDE